MVIIIAAILVTIALRSVVTITETSRVEETKREMEQLAFALIGNPELENNGVRTDFGYVGDVGSLPSGLDSLYTMPPGYTTWNGPYVSRRFKQITDDYAEDAWGVAYTYTGGTEIISTGSGSNIVRKLADSASYLLYNQVTGVVLDNNGAPPGSEKDTVKIELTMPDGTGDMVVRSTYPDAGGYFSLDSIPIGNHDISVIYLPIDDTLKRFVSVLPNSVLYQEYFLTFNPWSTIPPTEGCFEYVEGSAQTLAYGTTTCNGFEFQVTNICGVPRDVSSITLEYTSSPDAFYQNIKWNNEAALNATPDRIGTGETADFQEPFPVEWVDGGETVTVQVYTFKDTRTGPGSEVPMNDLDITVTLSDGSTFSFNTGDCAE